MMKRNVSAALALLVLALFLLARDVHAQEERPTAPADSPAAVHALKSQLWQVEHRNPQLLAATIKLLGSGAQGADLNANSELSTLTARDFPENLAAIGDAIARLDQPTPRQPDLELHISVLIGSSTPAAGRDLPAELVDVVQELQTTLRYESYSLLTTAVHRTHPGTGIEGSGVAETSLLGMNTPEAQPVFYSYTLRRISVPQGTPREAVDIEAFRFQIKIPIARSGGEIQYQDVGFDTPVTIREGEKVVVGTTTTGNRVLIVVVTAEIDRQAQ